ncbi:unnamed protein product [Amoebophrya sp. A25]|nr:unnamed protein product [Amoebophrya sp. A25]|eukprot:GSA25T00019283001.1
MYCVSSYNGKVFWLHVVAEDFFVGFVRHFLSYLSSFSEDSNIIPMKKREREVLRDFLWSICLPKIQLMKKKF